MRLKTRSAEFEFRPPTGRALDLSHLVFLNRVEGSNPSSPTKFSFWISDDQTGLCLHQELHRKAHKNFYAGFLMARKSRQEAIEPLLGLSTCYKARHWQLSEQSIVSRMIRIMLYFVTIITRSSDVGHRFYILKSCNLLFEQFLLTGLNRLNSSK